MLHRSFIDGIKTCRVQGFKQSKTQNSARLITRKTNRNRTYVAIVIASNDDRAEENAQKKKTSKNGEDSNAYSKTVILPQAKFEMRANSVLKEPLMQKWWEISFLCFYRRTRESERSSSFFFTQGEGVRVIWGNREKRCDGRASVRAMWVGDRLIDFDRSRAIVFGTRGRE